MARSTTNQERRRVAAAFRRMARGVEPKRAYASTVGFYRSSGQEWTRQLG
ncbi:MAG: hypothetical protein K0R53_2875 [Burkholderiales bacterium]|jgi:hypothetical protein|nr:hypothetical protein [Burkholderiales bacterium]